MVIFVFTLALYFITAIFIALSKASSEQGVQTYCTSNNRRTFNSCSPRKV